MDCRTACALLDAENGREPPDRAALQAHLDRLLREFIEEYYHVARPH